MGFALAKGVSCCVLGAQLMFLDIERDRYFCLTPEADLAFCQLIAAAPLDPAHQSIIDGLVARGLLARTDDDRAPVACIGPGIPELSLIDTNRACSTVAVIQAGVGLYRTARALRRQRWPSVLAALAHDKAQLDPARTSDEALADVAAAFEQLGGFITPIDQCVPRSVAVMRRSIALGLAPTLVIGVRLRPFAAHCWVQHQKLLVNERVDRARNFTPILTV